MTSKTTVSIQAIDNDTVNQICSGQVVLSLATAVKELLENSIDAGADCVQIRLREYGSEMIEVSDNGCGVEETNFQALTLKHHTSKISDFADLINVETFGFRGEALSSLCSLSNVTVITRHKSALFGTKLQMNHNGIIVNKIKTARQIGTTVILENLFKTLPVRHKEFLRNLKKEFTKMCSIVYAYGIQACKISVSCTNQVAGKKLIVMETKGQSVKSNVACIFGTKQTQNILTIKEVLPNDEILEEYGIKREKLRDDQLKMYELDGHISSCAHGSGRSSTDRQFYYINSRPVDNLKLTKLVNDVYHQYNPHQYPFVVLNIKVSLDAADINVTPDKRQILLDNEKMMLATLKATLVNLYKNIPSSLEMRNTGLIPSNSIDSNCSTGSWTERLQRFRSSNETSPGNTSSGAGNRTVQRQPSLDSFVTSYSKEIPEDSKNFVGEIVDSKIPLLNNVKIEREIDLDIKIESDKEIRQCLEVQPKEESGSHVMLQECMKEEKLPEKESESVMCSIDVKMDSEVTNALKRKVDENLLSMAEAEETKRVKVDEGITECDKRNRKSVLCHLALHDIKSRKRNKIINQEKTEKEINFFSKINPQSNEAAENELKKQISKDMFKHMEIIGQFNLGFIITRLGDDLFIVDQHATDEKYNFETLQLNTVIQTQKLVVPQILELTVEKEELLMEHENIFRKNGFDFVFDEEEAPTKRVKLTAIPLSKNWIFGKDDVDELLFMLEDSPITEMCRPSRVRDMFASRACRKSVMIGTALNHQEMRRLIDHMGEIQQPWNCPHGRPTIRHLLNLCMIHQ